MVLQTPQLVLSLPAALLSLLFLVLGLLEILLFGLDLGLQLLVANRHVVGLCLQLSPTLCHGFDGSLHLVNLLPPLSDSVLDFVSFLAQILHRASLHI